MAKLRKLVEEAISDYGGEITKNAVMYHLEKTHKLDPDDILKKPELFVKALRDMYGDFESIIEGNICEKIAREYGIDYKGEGLVELSKELRGSEKA